MRVDRILSQISFKRNETPEDLGRKKRTEENQVISTEEAEILLGRKNKMNYFA